MANLHRSVRKVAEATNFRFIKDIDSLDDETLNQRGYYRGFICPHGHVIRDSQDHWCYHCVHKIKSNICGFDINYINVEYKAKIQRLWNDVTPGAFNECWEIDTPGPYLPKRVCMPSYRSMYSHQKSENLSVQKCLYHCAWGDVGAMFVTRVCGNKRCGNPLHMTSSWNQAFAPETIKPFVLNFQAEKLMCYSANKDNPLAFSKNFRNTITPSEGTQIRGD